MGFLRMADVMDAQLIPEVKNPKINKPEPVVNGVSSEHTEALCVSKSRVDSDKYKFKSGIAVVINNISFDPRLNLGDRKGSDVDASSLFQRFQELGFDSDLLNDATHRDMEEKFDEIKEDKKVLKDADCLIVALLTHGKEDTIYATDQEIKIKTIMDKFNATNCPELALKPKIFILQACRGSEVGSGVNATVIRDPNQADAAAETNEYDKIHGEIIRIPNEADFLAVYASSQGYGSFRNTEKGSPFVRILSDELLSMKEGEDFYTVLTRVNRKVGTQYKPNYSAVKNPTQMPCFVSHLTKQLILK